MTYRFCVACGGALAPHGDEGRERLRCERCDRIEYRNPKPAVGAVVMRDGRVLLSRRAREPHKGSWDLPGGFLEAGETPEEGILRELREETGLACRVRALLLAAPGRWGPYDTLNLVYACDAEGEPTPNDDSDELRWFDPDRLPPLAFPHEAAAVARALAESP